MSKKKQRNTIITDWLEKYGDPEIDKKVEERLEQITKIMSDKKQSSIEWLLKKIWLEYRLIPNDDIIEQAKAMHKEEIANAWNDGHSEGMEGGYCTTYEEYYNETFEK